jgi:hypothetical protein
MVPGATVVWGSVEDVPGLSPGVETVEESHGDTECSEDNHRP